MIEKHEVEKLAALARLHVPDDEIDALTRDLDSILESFSVLERIPAGEYSAGGFLENRFRRDEEPHASGRYTRALLSLVPRREGDHVSVEKVIIPDEDEQS